MRFNEEGKVVILAPLPPPAGGIASWAVRMQHVQLKNSWKVSVVDEKLIGRSSHGDKNRKNYFVEARRCVIIWRSLVHELKNSKKTVVHACTAATTTGMLRDCVSCAIAHKYNVPFIINFRCTVPNLIHGGLKKGVFKLLCNMSDTVMVLNRQSYDYAVKEVDTSIKLVPNFVEDTDVMSGKKRTYSASAKTILYTGGVTEEKGCAEIIQAAKEFPNIKFRMVGNVRDEIKTLEMPSNVELTGVKDKEFVQKELMAADVYVFFTHMDSEGFSNSLVEAMSAGLPCIVTDWSANKDMIENKGGIVLPIHDVDGLVDAISRIKDDKSIREAYGKWNVKKVEGYYSSSVVTSRYVDIYDETWGYSK